MEQASLKFFARPVEQSQAALAVKPAWRRCDGHSQFTPLLIRHAGKASEFVMVDGIGLAKRQRDEPEHKDGEGPREQDGAEDELEEEAVEEGGFHGCLIVTAIDGALGDLVRDSLTEREVTVPALFVTSQV